MVQGLAALLLLQVAGEAVSRLLRAPVPGPVVGLLLTVLVLQFVPSARAVLSVTASGLLSHLSLLFVPAGVGVILYLSTLAEHGIAIALAILVSTALGLATTAWIAKVLLQRRGPGDET